MNKSEDSIYINSMDLYTWIHIFAKLNNCLLIFFQFRNQYDSDVTVWSPQGRLHQVEYAMEAVKLGSATVGLKNKTHAVLIALKRASSELSAHQKKIIPIDKHMGISISGLTADARILRCVSFVDLQFLLHM